VDIEELKYPDSPGLVKIMADLIRDMDKTRPVGMACFVPSSAESDIPKALDVVGWNYARKYMTCRKKWPDKPLVYSESASAFSTRGYFDDFPMPSKKDAFPATFRISSYDHNSAGYSDPCDVEFALMDKDRFVAGEFVWTGFDYIGEPSPLFVGDFKLLTKKEDESRISLFGIVDLAGIPKDRYYLYQSHWAPEKNTVHILPHWNWPERVGKNTPVYVYTAGDSAELFLNGKSLGVRVKNPEAEVVRDRYALRWLDIPYEPGKVEAVAFRKGRIIGRAVVKTAGEPAKLRVTPDRKKLNASGEDLSYLLVEAVDQDGNLCPLAMNDVTFAVEGPAKIAGVANGDHHFPVEFVADHVPLFYGKAVVVIRAEEGKGGSIDVAATSGGLRDARVSLKSAPKH